MPSIACVVVHPIPIFREGLTSILAKSPFDPVCTASTIDDVPATIGGLGEPVLVLIGVRNGDNLGEALSAAKASFPDGHIVVVGDSRRRDLVTTAIASDATTFVDDNVATSALIKQLELIAQGEPVISVLLLKRLLGNSSSSAPPSVKAAPILEIDNNDPVAQGFIASMAHPGGNITGFSFLEYSMVGKSLEMLKQVAPSLTGVAVMFNPDTYPYYNIFLRSFEGTARMLSLEVTGAPIRTPTDIEETIAKLGGQQGSGLLVTPDPFNTVHRKLIMHAAERHRVPASYSYREYVRDGALMSYGADVEDIVRRTATYVDRILKGANPADLPAQAPTKFELAINLKTAKALRLEVPPTLLALSDEIVE